MNRPLPPGELFDEDWLSTRRVLRTDRIGEFTHQRLADRDGQRHWLGISVAWSQGAAARKLEDEHRLTMRLDPAYACQSVLIRTRQGPVLVVEDGPLGRGLGQAGAATSMGEQLAMARQAAAALAHVHERGLLHGDLRPESFVRDGAGRLRLTNFARAREQASPSPGPAPDDALPYAAPEAALRTAPWADQRSDLYALGIILFELVTGHRPFVADSPAGWLHAHVAILPPRPSSVRAEIPTAIDAILLKLTAKNPEARYQSASSLSLDLARCLAAWTESGAIAAFPLDVSAGQRLYTPRQVGREPELRAFDEALQRVRSTGASEMVLVTGASGSGKSFLVETFLQSLEASSVTHAVSRGQLTHREAPYGVVVQLLRRLLQDFLDHDRPRLDEGRTRILHAAGASIRAIIELVPEYEILLGTPPPAMGAATGKEGSRLENATLSVLGAFATSDRPLIVVLDDLQWADAASWTLLQAFAKAAPPAMLLIGLHRLEDRPRKDPLTALHGAAYATGPKVSLVALQSLGLAQIASMMAQAMLCAPSELGELPSLVHTKTGGAPYFAMQFLQALIDERLLRRDARGRWVWQADDVLRRSQTDNVVDLLLHRIGRLDEGSRALLQTLAWIGASGSLRMLMTLLETNLETICAAANPLVDAGLLLKDDLYLAFTHDRVQEAAYAITPAGERPGAHARVASLMIEQFAPDADMACQVANQIQLAADGVLAASTAVRFVEVLVLAARRALDAGAADQAWRYLQTARRLLGVRPAKDVVILSHEVCVLNCRCLIQQARLSQASLAIAELLEQAPSAIDRARAYCFQATVRTLESNYEGTIEACLAGLRLLGFNLPRHPSVAELDGAYAAVRLARAGRDLTALADLPVSQDENLAMAMQLLAAMVASSFIDDGMGFLHLAKMVELTLLHGATPYAPHGLAWFGVLSISRFAAYEEGHGFAQAALKMAERRGWENARASVLLAGDQTSGWTQPLSLGLDLVRQAARIGDATGDLAISCYARNHIVSDLLAMGQPLPDVVEEARHGLSVARRVGFRDIERLIEAQLSYIVALQAGDVPDQAERREGAALSDVGVTHVSQTTVFWETLMAGLTAHIYGRSERARLCLDAARSLAWSAPAHIDLADLSYFAVLAMTAGGAAPLPADLEALQTWARLNPTTFRARSLLAEAETARVRGDDLRAMSIYEAAAAAAAVAGQWREQAMAHELAGDFQRTLGLETSARAHYAKAREAYEGWGASGKVRQLEQREPYLVGAAPSGRGPMVSGQAILDTAAALQAAQALSEEILLDRLIEKLMASMLVHAGADYGVLLLKADEDLRIEATATVGPEGPIIVMGARPPTSQDVPLALLHTVMASGRPVIFEDATPAAGSPFSTGPATAQARSVAGLPLIKQGRLIGVLYLENRLLPAVFTTDRMRLLELLAPQAAISLENARLYAQVLDQDARRRRSEAALGAARAELAQTAHLTAMGGLAASIGHEINQPLQSIIGNVGASLRWMDRSPPDLDEVRTNLRDIDRSAQRAGSIVKGLRALARKEALAKAPVQVDAVVREVLALVDNEITTRGVKLAATLSAGQATTLADPVQLQQVVLNLLTNALDAVRQTPTPAVKVRSIVRGDRIIVAIEDNGPGVAPQVRERMFDPLFTTKSSGMGMGLAICRSIIEAHGGRLDLAAPEGQGARLEFDLPTLTA